jgi:O-antigen/teichoic acid export membrane protein
MVAFITPAFAVLLPEFSRKAKESTTQVSVLGGQVAQLFLAVVIPGAILLALIAEPLLVFLYGSSFAAAKPVIQFLAAVLFLRSLEYLFSVGMISVNKSWLVFIVAGSSLVVNVALNLLWIPKWGFMGAVYGKLVSEIVVFCLSLGLFQLAVRSSLFPKWILSPIASGAVFIAAIYLLRDLGAVASFCIGLGTYVVCFSLLGRSTLRTILKLGHNQ